MTNRNQPAKPCAIDKSTSGMTRFGGPNSGEPVGPRPLGYSGLTKLETAAIAAMQGFVVHSRDVTLADNSETVAKLAARQANALFDELEKDHD